MDCFLVASVVDKALSVPPDFDYDFSGFTQLTQLLIQDCTDILGQVGLTDKFNREILVMNTTGGIQGRRETGLEDCMNGGMQDCRNA